MRSVGTTLRVKIQNQPGLIRRTLARRQPWTAVRARRGNPGAPWGTALRRLMVSCTPCTPRGSLVPRMSRRESVCGTNSSSYSETDHAGLGPSRGLNSMTSFAGSAQPDGMRGLDDRRWVGNRDLPDFAGPVLGEPQVAVRTGRDAQRIAAGRRDGELRDDIRCLG